MAHGFVSGFGAFLFAFTFGVDSWCLVDCGCCVVDYLLLYLGLRCLWFGGL